MLIVTKLPKNKKKNKISLFHIERCDSMVVFGMKLSNSEHGGAPTITLHLCLCVVLCRR